MSEERKLVERKDRLECSSCGTRYYSILVFANANGDKQEEGRDCPTCFRMFHGE